MSQSQFKRLFHPLKPTVSNWTLFINWVRRVQVMGIQSDQYTTSSFIYSNAFNQIKISVENNFHTILLYVSSTFVMLYEK